MTSTRTPTVTSYALLGLLGIRPWSSYELTKQMGRALHHVLPRAESNVYAEAKRLVTDGLATAEQEATGRRARTVYTITPAGRAALEAWLRTAARPTTLESEGMVKVLFADRLPKDQLIGHIRRLGAEAEAARAPFVAVAEEYLQDRGPFPARFHVNTLFWVFAARYATLRVEWARWAEEFVATWPGPEGPDHDTLRAVLAGELRAASG